MSEKVRWGILSTANIAKRKFMPAIQKSEKAIAVAVSSRDADKAREFAEEFDIPKAYGSYEEMLQDPEVEAVYIGVPNNWHAEWTMKAADAGKHVLCEKPITVDAEEAKRVADRCREKDVLLMEAFMYRLNPRTLLMNDVIESGILGHIKSVYSEFSFNLEPRHATRLIPGKGAGALMDIGCYCINVSRYAYAAEPESVVASSHYHPEIGCDMTTSAILDFGQGRFAQFTCSFESAYRNYLQITGTLGILRVDKPFTPEEEGTIGFDVQTWDNKHHAYQVDAVDQFLAEIDIFSDCIRQGKEVPLDPYKESVANMAAIDAVRKSAETGQKQKT